MDLILKFKRKNCEMILLKNFVVRTLIVFLVIAISQESLPEEEGKEVDVSCFSDTCENRKNSELSNPLRMTDDTEFERSPCFCDDDCSVYGDCCRDKYNSKKNTGNHNIWLCERISDSYKHFYVIGSCPEEWTDKNISNLCRRDVLREEYSYLLDVPIFSEGSQRMYANLYCAQCYRDFNLKNTDLKLAHFPLESSESITRLMKNATYKAGERKWTRHGIPPLEGDINLVVPYSDEIILNYGLRRCKPIINKCSDSYRGSEVEKRCQSNINSYVGNIARDDIYKNVDCAICNNISHETLNKNCDTERKPNGRITPTFFHTTAYSILFDFNPGRGPVGYKTCPAGKILDPIGSKCIPFGCGDLYDKVNGKCLLKITTNTTSDNVTKIHTNCRTLFVGKIDASILENSTLYMNRTKKTYNPGQYEIYNSTLFRICSENIYQEKFSAIQSRLSTVTMTISFCCLAAHIIIHLMLPKLRNLPGKNLLSLSISLFIGQIVFFFGINKVQIRELCIVIGIVIHFCFLAVFFWMSIMAVDIYSTFTKLHARIDVAAKSKIYIKYSIIGWFLPLMIVVFAIITDNTNIFPEIRPAYGQQLCWISQRKGLLAFFVTPAGILLILNSIIFVLTAYGIHQTSHVVQCAKKTSESIRFYLYLKLAFIMGLTWIFGFIAAFAEIPALWYVFIVLNASQGAFILIAFTLKRKVLQQLFQKTTGKSLPVFGKTNTLNTSVKYSSRRASSSRMLHQQRSNLIA